VVVGAVVVDAGAVVGAVCCPGVQSGQVVVELEDVVLLLVVVAMVVVTIVVGIVVAVVVVG
jgi:hypothetical protein